MQTHTTIYYRMLTCMVALVSLVVSSQELHAINAKIDAGPAYIHVDDIEFHKTVRQRDLIGGRGEAFFWLDRGFAFKATVLGAKDLFNSMVGVGWVLPFKDKLFIIPYIGPTYTWEATKIKRGEFEDIKFFGHRKTHSLGVFGALEVTYKICQGWRITGTVQYSFNWTRSKGKEPNPLTGLLEPFNSKEKSQGPAYSLMLEYDVTKCWSVNIAAGYNQGLSKEKHGLRAYGVKLGLTRWF